MKAKFQKLCVYHPVRCSLTFNALTEVKVLQSRVRQFLLRALVAIELKCNCGKRKSGQAKKLFEH